MNHDSYPDDYLRDILTSAKTIAVVGASPRSQRPSHGVMRYLQGQGYRAIPVTPVCRRRYDPRRALLCQSRRYPRAG